jgi:DNA adenine methylase
MIKSPLRYPGGKSKAIKTIERYFPAGFTEYREPFVGGGSIFIYLKQVFPDLKVWINDLNPEVYLFWKIAQSDLKKLVQSIREIKQNSSDGKVLFKELTTININDLSELERAVRFFVLNRITFSGTVESGGFSQQAFNKRFTDSSIDRLESLELILDNIKITNLDYGDVIKSKGEKVFIYLDPPYFNATQSRLYGKDGHLHLNFDHQRFASLMKKCNHQWLISYDNSDLIKENFINFKLIEWELQYGMNNYKQKNANKGKELLIRNYDIDQDLTINKQSSEFIPDCQQLEFIFNQSLLNK